MRISKIIILISIFSSSLADVLFAPILLGIMSTHGYSSWLIASTTALEFIPRLFGPLYSKLLTSKRMLKNIKGSMLARFISYLIIATLLMLNNQVSIVGILIVLLLNLFSDFNGSLFYLSQTVVNRSFFSQSEIKKLTPLFFIFSNMGIFVAYFLAPTLSTILVPWKIAVINAFLFLLPLIEISIIKIDKINLDKNNAVGSEVTEGKKRWLILTNKHIIAVLIVMITLNIFIGNPNFIVTAYAKEFSLNPIAEISRFSSIFLIGTLISAGAMSFMNKTMGIRSVVALSFPMLAILYVFFGIPDQSLKLIIFLFTGIVIGIGQPILDNEIYSHTNENTVGIVFSITRLFNSLATIISPFLIQTVLFFAGYQKGVLTISVYYLVIALVLVVYLTFLREKKDEKN